MPATTLQVCIGDPPTVVGTLIFEAKGNRAHSTFQYASSWLEHPRRFAIDPGLPLDDQRRFFKSDGPGSSPLPGAIADTLPDSWGRGIIQKDARLNPDTTGARTGPLVEIDYLSAVDDFSRMGALRFRPAGRVEHFLSSGPAGIQRVPALLEIDKLGKDIADFERDHPDAVALRRLRQIGTPFGGARPKCSVIDRDSSLAIAKFTSTQDTMAVERAEVMTLALARQCGLNASHARIEMSAGLPVAIIKRFDRSSNGGRRPYLSAQTMLQFPSATGATYTEMADAIRAHGAATNSMLDELFKRIAFTILVSNVDDHLKNHGFLYVGDGQWDLSPLFDVNPAPERFRELKTAIANVHEPQASIELLLEHSNYFEVERDDGAELIQSMASTIADQWQSLADAVGMSRKERDAFENAFVHSESDFALALHRSTSSYPVPRP